ncbi:MAG: Holliday junction branch migration protein RuvA [Bacteroides sp.]|nr:Holliday junction branch migration protein RuvA [Bacteroides sp.]MCM1550597.1 Holliday junction branch migration protein RuvA [Clostridium sp.]
MLAYITGTLEEIQEDSVVIDYQGMGYRIFVSAMELGSLPGLGQRMKLHLHMLIREDDISLYGFSSKDALYIFRLLISVSGIGPKAGLAILSALSVNEIQMAIVSGDVKALTKANGVGTKGAQRVIMELKDRIDLDSMLTSVPETSGGGTAASDTITAAAMALTSLGYSQMEAMQAIQRVEQSEAMTEEELLKAALKKIL